jgi:hypothetical protein
MLPVPTVLPTNTVLAASASTVTLSTPSSALLSYLPHMAMHAAQSIAYPCLCSAHPPLPKRHLLPSHHSNDKPCSPLLVHPRHKSCDAHDASSQDKLLQALLPVPSRIPVYIPSPRSEQSFCVLSQTHILRFRGTSPFTIASLHPSQPVHPHQPRPMHTYSTTQISTLYPVFSYLLPSQGDSPTHTLPLPQQVFLHPFSPYQPSHQPTPNLL